MADVNVLDLSEVTPGSGDSLILFDRTTGAATSTRFETLKSAVKGTLDNQVQALEDNDELMLNVLGAKNLLPNNAVSQTLNGVTFTVNSDGSVTLNGTATGDYWYRLFQHSYQLPSGRYILSGCPEGGSNGTYRLTLANDVDVTVHDYGNGAEFDATGVIFTQCFIKILSGQTFSNLTFYPMIRPASIADDTYVPYAPTNRELAAQVKKSEVLVIEVPSFSTLPQTISNANIEDDMVVVNSALSNPCAQMADWVVTTSNGSLTISGSISGATTAKLYLMKSR